MKNYTDNEKLDWLKLIYPNFKNEDWHNENVYKPTDLKYFEFFDKKESYIATITPKNIIGIKYYPNYNYHKSITWIELFFELHRLNRVIDNFKNIDDLTRHIVKNIDLKQVYKYGGHFFTTSGQHRLCLAKLLEISSINVSVVEYKLNKPKLVRSLKLIKYQNLFKHINVHATGNNLENIHFKISDRYIKMKFELFEAFIKYYHNYQVFKPFQKIQLFLIGLRNKANIGYDFEINSKNDIKKLNYLILKNKIYNQNL